MPEEVTPMSRTDDICVADAKLAVAPNLSAVGKLSNHHVFSFATLLLLLPNALFALSALRPIPAIIVLGGCLGVGAVTWRWKGKGEFLSASLDVKLLGSCLAAGFALCVLGGEGHFFYANSDWLTRDGVLADLVRDGTTPLYQYGGQDYYLRAPLGMYMLPAMIGRIFGLFSAHMTLLATNALIFGAILYLASSLAGARPIVILAIMIGFGGLDIIGELMARAASLRNGDLTNQKMEWWSMAFVPETMLQYSGHVTQLFWAPNHTAPGWFIAVLVLLRSRKEISVSILVACCAMLVLWSPLSVLGAVPFIVVLMICASRREVASPESLLAAATGLCFLPIALYLVMGSGAVAHGWMIDIDGFVRIYPLFLLIEIPQATVLLYTWRKIETADRIPLAVAIVTLCLLPFYGFGPNNDLVMRASIPALFLVAFSFARVAIATRRDGSVLPTIIACIVLISAATPLAQVKQAFAGNFAISDCNLLTIWQSTEPVPFPSNYLAPEASMPRWLIAREAPPEPLRLEYRDCWPGHPLRSMVWRDGG
jgi:hypothetical protein